MQPKIRSTADSHENQIERDDDAFKDMNEKMKSNEIKVEIQNFLCNTFNIKK